MTNLLEIRRRLKATSNIAQILEAMQVITYTKIRKNQDKIKQSRNYQDRIGTLIGTVINASGQSQHPWLGGEPSTGQTLLLVYPAQEGFASEFDRQLSRSINKFLADRPDRAKVMILGRKANLHLSVNKDLADPELVPLSASPTFAEAKVLSQTIGQGYLAKKYRAAFFAYNSFRSILSQPTLIKQLLPLPAGDLRPETVPTLYFWEDQPPKLLEKLLGNYLAAWLFQIMIDSRISELYTRLRTLRSATDNAKDLAKELANSLNKTRQALITQELSNIFSSFLILKGGDEQTL